MVVARTTVKRVIARAAADDIEASALSAEKIITRTTEQNILTTTAVHDVVAVADMNAAANRSVDALLGNGPVAVAGAKKLIRDVAGRAVDEAVMNDTAGRIADIRASAEGKEGVAAFLEKRKPNWS